MNFRKWIYIAISLFFAGIVLGLIAPEPIAGVLSQNLSSLREMASVLGPFKISTAVFIYIKNVSTLLMSFALSPLLGVFPLLVLVINGALISFVIAIVTQGQPLSLVLAAILPHGIIELAAIIIGEAAALSSGFLAIMALIKEERRKQFLPRFKRNLKFLLLACALLVPAALIETFITPLFIR